MGIAEDLTTKIKSSLQGLGRPIDDEQVPALKIALTEYVQSIARASEKAPFIDLPLVFKLQESALEILEQYQALDSESKQAASAGIKYFLLRDDARNGFLHPGGFEDDALVLAAVTIFIATRKSGIEKRSWAEME
jgi:uncharacterized membrane protein YkvA (DUF1232 family)